MKNREPKVSVIIPFYNGKEWLMEAVDSVLRQSYKNTEIIVVNDGSQEDLTEFQQAYRGKIEYYHKEHQGPGAARNIGIAQATGELIAFIDADDIWFPDKLEKQVALMGETNAIWSHTSYSLFLDPQPHNVLSRIDVSDFQGMVFPQCLLSSPIATPCVMVQSSYLKENPQIRFSEKMRYGQDGYLWLNLAVDHPLFVVPGILTKVRKRKNSTASRARSHLYMKGNLWEHIRQHKARFRGRGKMSPTMATAYKMCFHANNLVVSLEKTKVFSARALENISRLFYFLPYMILKYHGKLSFGKKSAAINQS